MTSAAQFDTLDTVDTVDTVDTLDTLDTVDTLDTDLLTFTPSTRVLWRSTSRVQLELGRRRVVVDGLSCEAVDRLSPGWFPDLDARLQDRRPKGIDELLRSLHRSGFLSRTGSALPQPGAGEEDTEWATNRAGLAPDLAALGERFGESSEQVMRARQGRVVSVEGSGRLPAMIAALLAAAGVGHVHVPGDSEVGLWDAAPGGIARADEGRRTAAAADDAIRRAAPRTNTRWVPHSAADLIVLAGSLPAGSGVHNALLTRAKPHLSTTVWASSAVIGPLVIPGVTSCLGCADLHRCERDPVWPALAAQIAAIRRVPTDVAMCALAAALTALQALAFLDGERPATADGTLEMALPDWRLRRRSWFAHEHCLCQQ